MIDLSDIPNKKLIKMIKDNPDNISYATEFLGRLDTGEVTADEVLMYLEFMVFNGG